MLWYFIVYAALGLFTVGFFMKELFEASEQSRGLFVFLCFFIFVCFPIVLFPALGLRLRNLGDDNVSFPKKDD
jgi:uncharacterized membrane protein YhaH (DUF805 family)